MKKKILILVIMVLAFSGSYVFAGGSMAPYIRATTVDRPFGTSSASNNMIISFCNNDKNSPNQTVKLKIQTKAVKTNGIKPKKKAAGTKSYTAIVNTDGNACGNARITVKNGMYNVKVRIKEREGGASGWWTSWSGYWTTQ